MAGIRYLTLFAALVLLAGLIALGIHLFTSGEEYSRYNPEWNGTSVFFSEMKTVPEIRGGMDLSTTSCRTLLVLAPRFGFGGDGGYSAFLAQGGRIILVDEEGSGNAFLSSIPGSLRVLPGNLSSLDSAYDAPSLVHAYPGANHTLLQNVSLLTLNRPAIVAGGDPLVETSLLTWLDENGDGRPNGGEVLQRYVVMAREGVGTGEVVVIADASLFINGMRTENPQFLENLRSLPEVCLDQRDSQTETAEILPSLLLQVKDTYIIELIVVTMVMLIGALIGERRHG